MSAPSGVARRVLHVSVCRPILAFRSHDPDRRLSALVLEVKGDFCHKLREIAARHGRADDYVEVGLESGIRYNPLHNDLEAYALAYGIASLLNNLFGHSEEPFWQQAYTNLVKFLILLHKVARRLRHAVRRLRLGHQSQAHPGQAR